MKTILTAVVLAGLAGAPTLGAAQQQAPSGSAVLKEEARDLTIQHLREAAKGEANAANRYELFAERADKEGFGQVAKLFRAAGESERIHLRNHQAVLRSLGEKPEPIALERVEVKSTRENLLVPIEGERDEATATYPLFAADARKAGIAAAALSFTYAGEAEAGHAKLFQAALDQLGSNPPADYFVQSESGVLSTRTPGRVASVTSPTQG